MLSNLFTCVWENGVAMLFKGGTGSYPCDSCNAIIMCFVSNYVNAFSQLSPVLPGCAVMP